MAAGKSTRLRAVCCVLGLLAPAVAFGQMTQITGTGLRIGQNVITAGTVCAVAVDANETPISVAVGGGGMWGVGQSCARIVAGTITTATIGGTYSLPDVALASNPDFYYSFTITDTLASSPTRLQSYTLHKVPGVTGTTYALDRFVPPTTVSTAPVFSFTTGIGAPTGGCSGKAFYQDITTPAAPVLYQCSSDGHFHSVGGSTDASALTSGTLGAARLPAFSGDITTPAGSSVSTLANVNSSSGTCGDATHVCQVVTNAKGQVTGQSQVAIAGGGGGGGGDLPSGDGIVAVASGIGGLATKTQMFAALYDPSTQNTYLVDSVPTAPGTDNVLIGKGVAPNLSGSGDSGAAGQHNVVIGHLAGNHMTTSRESVIIGEEAGFSITGNGTGPDDMIVVLVGSEAGGALTNAGGASVMIGQKSGVSDQVSGQDVFVGVHSCTGCTSTGSSVVIGAETDDTANAVQLSNEIIIGQGAGPVFTGSYLNDVIIGQGAGTNQQSGATRNVFVGSSAGYTNTTGNNNICFGFACAAGTTGTHNVVIGPNPTGTQITSGSNNVLLGNLSGYTLSSGQDNIFVGESTGTGIAAGSFNLVMGDQAAHGAGDISQATILGFDAGAVAAASNVVAVGSRACSTMTTGAGNTCVGNGAGNGFVTGANNTALGDSTLTALTGAESNDIAIGEGQAGVAGESNATWIGNSSTTSAHIYGTNFTPASSSASCSPPQFAYDASFMYVCTATNTWKRVAIATW